MIGSTRARNASAHAALALAAALLVLGWRAPLMDLPLERDEGEYAYIAWRLAAGETPYLDWFDQKPPGVFLAYRLALALPGDPIAAIRSVAALFAAGSALALFGLVRALLGPLAGFVSALLLILLSADPMLNGPIANTEVFMVPWIVVAALFSLRGMQVARSEPQASEDQQVGARTAATAGLAVGVALGIATAFKQVAVVNAPFWIALVWLRAKQSDRARSAGQFGAAMAAGGLLVWMAILFWFWQRGALAPAIDAILLHNLEYTAELTVAERLEALAHFVPPLVPSQGIAWLLAAIGFVVLALRRDDRLPALFLGAFAAANAIGVSASGFYFPHYFQQLLPAVAALAAAAIVRAGGSERGWRRRPLVWAGVAVALVPLVVAAVEFWRIDPGEAARRIYPDNFFDAMPAIAAEVAAQTSPEDRVFLFGSEPEVLFYARRVSASRYIFLFPLFGTWSDAEQRQAEVIAEVERARPAAIVWMPLRSFFGRGRPQLVTEWTAGFVRGAYRLHAFAVNDASGRTEVKRIAPGAEPVAEPGAWATIFLRVPSG